MMEEVIHMEKIKITEVMAICSNCYHEFDLGEEAFIDKDGDYICKDCAK